MERLRDALSDPARFPGAPQRVEVIETHISVVFVTDDRVYKLKKPIELPFADFSSIDQRAHWCAEEVRLNQRLCPDIYLRVVPLYDGPDGLSFVSGDEVVDHAVLMRRLPAERMLDQLLDEGDVEADEIRRVARTLANFHKAHRVFPDPGEPGDPEDFARFARANFKETEPLRRVLFSRDLHDALYARTVLELEGLGPALAERARSGFAVDGHGDLHARNICLTEPPALYDCLEFSPAIRCGDASADTGFLVMDLRYRGAPDLADAFVREYVETSGDADHERFLPLMVSYRAMVRAKVAALVWQDESRSSAERDGSARSVRAHAQLAAGALLVPSRRVALVLACGLPGSGKSFVFEHLAHRACLTRIATDAVRKELAGVAEGSTLPATAYGEDAKARVYATSVERALDRWRQAEAPVLVDATFTSRAERDRAREVAARAGGETVVVYFRIDEATAIERIAKRGRDTASDADAAVFRKLEASFDVPADDESVIELDGADDADTSADRILADLLRR